MSSSLFENSQIRSATPTIIRENVRSKIALIFVWAFFSVLGIGFLIGYCESFKVDEYKDMLLAISGILSGPLGFIIGFYFKESSKNKQ